MDIVSPHKVNMANTHTQSLHIHVAAQDLGTGKTFGHL